jgi:hypothetical protein
MVSIPKRPTPDPNAGNRMEIMKDIAAAVGADLADPYELAQWLWDYFDGNISSTVREIIVSQGSTALLRVEFSKSHRLTAFRIAAALMPRVAEIREAIASDLLDDASKCVGAEVLFSSFPVDGFFKFDDKLQIRPVPPDAPKAPARHFGEQPFLLEYRFSESRNSLVTSYRKAQATRHLGALVAVFLEGVIKVQSHVLHGHWVNVPVNGLDGKPQFQSEFRAGQYICPGLKSCSTDFSPLQGFRPIAQIPEQVYYTRWGEILGRSLEIPDTLDKLLRIFFSLRAEERARFLRAAYWFAQAKSAYLVSKSYQYIAIVMAIETLAQQKSASERCQTCKRELENGPTRNFLQFLDEYCSGPDDAKALKRELYDLRCELSHGARLFLEDIDNRGLPLTPRMVEEDHKKASLYRLTQIALINWLYKRSAA